MDGRKTYITAGLMLLTSLWSYFGNQSIGIETLIQQILVALSVAGLRNAIK